MRYLASITFGVTAELANFYLNKTQRVDLEQVARLSMARFFRRITNLNIQQEYFEAQVKILGHSRLFLNNRDSSIFFHCLKRIIKVCLARAVFKDEKEPMQSHFGVDLDLERLNSEAAEVEILDQDTLNLIHEGQMQESYFKKLTNPNLDYSKMLSLLIERNTCFQVIDNIFSALSFIETTGLKLSLIFVQQENQQVVYFQVSYINKSFIISLMLWGSNHPLSAFNKASTSPFDVLVPFRLAIVSCPSSRRS